MILVWISIPQSKGRPLRHTKQPCWQNYKACGNWYKLWCSDIKNDAKRGDLPDLASFGKWKLGEFCSQISGMGFRISMPGRPNIYWICSLNMSLLRSSCRALLSNFYKDFAPTELLPNTFNPHIIGICNSISDCPVSEAGRQCNAIQHPPMPKL